MNMHRFAKLTAFLAGQAKHFACDDSGATAIEYAMIATGIAVAIIAAVMSLGTATNALYTPLVTALK
jgi:pilus assembly protein Flp/PilA